MAESKLSDDPRSFNDRIAVTDRVATEFLGFLEQDADDPDLLRQTAQVLRRQANLNRSQAKFELAESLYRQGIVLLRKSSDISESPTVSMATIETLTDYSVLLLYVGDATAAKAKILEAKKLAGWLDENDARTELLLARADANLANIEYSDGNNDLALKYGLDAARALQAHLDGDVKYNRQLYELISVNRHIADVYTRTGKMAAAIVQLQSVVRLADERIGESSSVDDRTARAQAQLGLAKLLLSTDPKDEQADRLLKTSTETLQQFAQEFPNYVSYRAHLASAMSERALYQLSTGQLKKALQTANATTQQLQRLVQTHQATRDKKLLIRAFEIQAKCWLADSNVKQASECIHTAIQIGEGLNATNDNSTLLQRLRSELAQLAVPSASD